MVLICFISGLGIGIIFANGAAIGSEFAPEKYRNLVVTLIVMGYAFGAMTVGPVANMIIPTLGWEMLFIFGGIFTLVMALAIYLYLPESVEHILYSDTDHNEKLAKISAALTTIQCELFMLFAIPLIIAGSIVLKFKQ